MAKDDSVNTNAGPVPASSGLLSKVVRFVRNPTTNWSDLDQQDADRESGYSKQMLKEMIERKRRNDFVRKREFDMLRKLRRREALGVQNPTARPSFFQISTTSSKPDDRAMTLKKIDEIEEQMSMQWWKTKHGENERGGGHFPVSSQSPTTGGDAGAITSPSPLENAPAQSPARPPVAADSELRTNFQQTEPAPMALLQQAGMKGAPPAAPPSYDLMASGFFGSEMFNVEVEDVAHDPELEEAAIRFANGDDAGAESGLLDAIAPDGARAAHEETWLALFDLYRATGRHDAFETQAERFTENFGRSPPAWFSIPEMLNRSAPKPAAKAPPHTLEKIHWACPPVLSLEALSTLVSTLKQTASPWNLDWRALSSMKDDAVEPLYRQLAILADQPMQLAFLGARHLETFLRDATPSGDRTVPQATWLLHMAVLRILRRADDFELVALNYCVTYEVSPPAWEPPQCGFTALDGDDSGTGGTIIGDVHESQISTLSAVHSEFASTSSENPESSYAALTVDLGGQIMGDATSALELLDSKLGEAEEMVISCANLIRVDFSAAGTLLNWVSTRHAHGKRVHFADAHRLVASFFGVIGISELARVSTRKD